MRRCEARIASSDTFEHYCQSFSHPVDIMSAFFVQSLAVCLFDRSYSAITIQNTTTRRNAWHNAYYQKITYFLRLHHFSAFLFNHEPLNFVFSLKFSSPHTTQKGTLHRNARHMLLASHHLFLLEVA
ncbi:hypothetical protein [Halodesulfovibrio sp. MK-HDV]|uniref:hypothetical protein n=1 Tax=Halodesulfovibrio sp. MK-HDV TaxID=2599925 RepID=UPI00136E6952|nr:hypothetical protein [Halodesulfovibrio sp. MK-HDV]